MPERRAKGKTAPVEDDTGALRNIDIGRTDKKFQPLTTPILCHALAAFEGVIISISHDRRYLNEVATTVYELTGAGLTRLQ